MDRVALRNEMRYSLIDAISQANEGNTSILKAILSSISGRRGYEVILDVQEPVSIKGMLYGYGDKTIMIKEDGERLFVIYKCQRKGRMMLDYSHVDMMTEEEDSMEYDWVKRAEQALNDY